MWKGQRKSGAEGWGLGMKFLYFLYQNGEFLCISGDIYWHCFFQKGTLIKKRVSGHPGHPLDQPLDI